MGGFEQMSLEQYRREMAAQRTEDDEQRDVVAWARTMGAERPALRHLFHIPNGGDRHPAVGAKLKRLGVQAGVPDLFLPVPAGLRPVPGAGTRPYAGLFLEMKRAGGGFSDLRATQRAWLLALRELGYAADVAFGAEAAQGLILAYLDGTYHPTRLP